jgi:hypothetical protein
MGSYDSPVSGDLSAVVTSLGHGRHPTCSDIIAALRNNKEVIKDARWQSWRIIEEHAEDGCALGIVTKSGLLPLDPTTRRERNYVREGMY